MKIPAPPWWLIPVLIALVVAFRFNPAHSETPDEWFRLVVAIEQQQDKLDADEKRFIRIVINRLTSVDKVPTPDHAHWLRNIAKRLNLP